MAHRNKVIRSVNAQGGLLYVDLFRRPDGSFGFEEFRRDPEDTSGWFAVGHHAACRFDTAEAALAAACAAVVWLPPTVAQEPDRR